MSDAAGCLGDTFEPRPLWLFFLGCLGLAGAIVVAERVWERTLA